MNSVYYNTWHGLLLNCCRPDSNLNKELSAAKAEIEKIAKNRAIALDLLKEKESENKRLREALSGIASYKGIKINSDRLADIAQEALDGGKQ